MVATKTCGVCKDDKPVEDFSKDKSRKDGLNIKCSECRKIYRSKRKNKYLEYQRNYRKENKSSISKYAKNKRLKDPIFKLKSNLRTRIWIALKNNKKEDTKQLLGASYETVRKHIESTFTENMSWKNYGQWHVDHIIPLGSVKTVEKVKELCHYTNLQALWANDNWAKNCKINI